MNQWIHYLPITDKEQAGARIIIFSYLLLFLSVTLFISNINFLLDEATPFVVNASNFLVWGIILAAFLYTKTEKRMRIVTPVVLLFSSGVLWGGLFTTGGLYSVDTTWAIVMILVAYLFAGVVSGIAFTLMALAGLLIYYYGEKNLSWSHGSNPLIREPDYVFYTLLCVVVALSGLLFAFVKTLNSLQQKNKELTEARFDELRMMLDSRSREIDTLRNKLARDFHDQTGSKLVTLKVLAGVLKSQAKLLPADTVEKIQLIEMNAQDLYAHTRDFIWSIDSRNSSLDEIMLHLGDFGNSFYGALDIEFTTDYNLKELRKYNVPVEHVMQLILILKEAMTNAGKYGACRNVSLVCEQNERHCTICIQDDGKGFEKETTGRKSGLKNMEERSQALNATLAIESVLSRGTSVSVHYPLQPNSLETPVLTI